MKIKAGDPIAAPDGTWCVWGEGMPLLWGSSQQTILSAVSLRLGSHTQAVEEMARGARRWTQLATQAPAVHRLLSKKLKPDTPLTLAPLSASQAPAAPILSERQREQRARKSAALALAAEGKTQREIGAELGMTRRAVSDLIPGATAIAQARAIPKVKTPRPAKPAASGEPAPHPRKVATDEQIIAAYDEHATVHTVAKEVCAHQRRVLTVLRAAGKLRAKGTRRAGSNPGGKPTALDTATIDALVARWLNGESTVRRLAAEYGISRGTVSAYIARAGVKTRKAKLDEEAVSWIVARYAQGESADSLAKAYGCSPSTIYDHVRVARWNGSLE